MDKTVIAKKLVHLAKKLLASDYGFLPPGLEEWIEENLRDVQKESLLKIVVPGLKWAGLNIASGKMYSGDVEFKLRYRDREIRITKDGTVYAYMVQCNSPRALARLFETDPTEWLKSGN